MLRVQRVSKTYGVRVVLKEASMEVRPGERVGLVGANGAGKSTLCDIVRGVLAPDTGDVIMPPNWEVGYLAQDNGLDPEKTILASLWEVFATLTDAQTELAEVEEKLRNISVDDPTMMDLIERQAALYDDIDRLGGHTAEAEIGKVLGGLGFKQGEENRTVGSFSGGWQVRIALARLLLGSSDLLLLDEPTNHLDTDAVDWLEDYLTSKPRTVLIVSHDRYFLDRVTNRTIELDNNVLTTYQGSYRKYVEEKERRIAAQEAAAEKQKEYLEDQKAMLDKFRATASKARMVQSREKQLAKMAEIKAPEKAKPPRFRFADIEQPGREVLRVRLVSKSYDKPIITEADFRVERGDKIAILGPNGAGKSTLLRLIAKIESPDAGGITWGHNVNVGYFAQNAADVLDMNQKVFDAVASVAPTDWKDVDTRSILGRFLFRGDDAYKKVSVLSGGEKNRVALARLLVRPYNFLLLDEPTNHLDIPAREALQSALAAYPGTLVLVSHDRYLVDGIATRILDLRDGTATMYDGDYEYYKRKLTERNDVPAVEKAPAPNDRQPGRAVSRRERRGTAVTTRSLESIEQELDEKEARKAELVLLLGDSEVTRDPHKVVELTDELHELERVIEDLVERWSELSNEAG